jgi:pilus assembly protein Flp/PilA
LFKFTAAERSTVTILFIFQQRKVVMGDRLRGGVSLTHWEFKMKLVQSFLTDESGATAIEYGLIAAGIAVAILAALTQTKDALIGVYGKISDALNK